MSGVVLISYVIMRFSSRKSIEEHKKEPNDSDYIGIYLRDMKAEEAKTGSPFNGELIERTTNLKPYD